MTTSTDFRPGLVGRLLLNDTAGSEAMDGQLDPCPWVPVAGAAGADENTTIPRVAGFDHVDHEPAHAESHPLHLFVARLAG